MAQRWYSPVLALLAFGGAVIVPVAFFASEPAPNAKQLAWVFGMTGWLLLAGLGMIDPERFRWALIVDSVALGALVVYANFFDPSPGPPRPPIPPDVRRFYAIAAGVLGGLGLLVAFL